jgi:ABC transport system ATP-binding/permease protein
MLAVRDLHFAHDARVLFDGATFTVADDARAALVGRNGAGKSTLLAMIAGNLSPDAGQIELGRGQRVALLAQTPDVQDVDVRTAVSPPGVDPHRVDEVLTRLGVLEWHKKITELSGGQRRRVDLARVLLLDADVLLLDEPTNHLDAGGIAFLAGELLRHRGPVLFVSHDRAFIDRVGTVVVELVNGKLVGHPPPGDATHGLYDAYIESKLLREQIDAQTQHRRSRLYVRELAWLRAGTPARTTKQRARIDRAEELADAVHDEGKRLLDEKKRVQIAQAEAARSGKTILVFDKCELWRGDRKVVAPFSLALTPGSRWGIVGENGTGKTTLLMAVRTACGDTAADPVTPKSGAITVGKNTQVAVFDQLKQSLDDDATLDDVLAPGNDHVFVGDDRIHVATYLEQFLFEGSDRYRRVKTLSGGQKSRLVLARMFQQGANVLVLDEPTNDLDVETLGVLEDALLAHKGCALIVSHDHRFLDRVATGILAFVPDDAGAHMPVPYPGDYTNFLRVRREPTAMIDGRAAKGEGRGSEEGKNDEATRDERKREKRKRSYKEQQEFQGIEEKIMSLESRRDEVSAIVNDGVVFATDPKKGAALADELATLERTIAETYARWELLSALDPS